jgi:hypothetical protein
LALSALEIPKGAILGMRNCPRDIFDSVEGIAPAALPAVTQFFLTVRNGGIGLDLDLFNDAAAAGVAQVTIDKAKVVTLQPGQQLILDNILYTAVEIRRLAAGAIDVDIRFAGISLELLKLLMPGGGQ